MSKEAADLLKKKMDKRVESFSNKEVQIAFTNGELMAIKMMARDWAEAAASMNPKDRQTIIQLSGSIIQRISKHFD
jgi:hypothetical protein